MASAQVPIPPVPPAPNGSNTLTAEQLRKQAKQATKAERSAQRQQWWSKAKGVNRQVWIAGGVFVGVAAVGWFVRSTWLELAAVKASSTELAPAPITTVTAPPVTAPPVVVQGLENPLSKLPLTAPARFSLGWSAQSGDLSPLRSAAALDQILADVDVCSYFIGLDGEARVLVQLEQFPGSYPMCGSQEVATPNDAVPLPTSTVAS